MENIVSICLSQRLELLHSGYEYLVFPINAQSCPSISLRVMLLMHYYYELDLGYM